MDLLEGVLSFVAELMIDSLWWGPWDWLAGRAAQKASRRRRRARRPARQCQRCGYDLRGHLAAKPKRRLGRCPECGRIIKHWQLAAWRRAARSGAAD